VPWLNNSQSNQVLILNCQRIKKKALALCEDELAEQELFEERRVFGLTLVSFRLGSAVKRKPKQKSTEKEKASV
jgi:hypothetical protein